MNDRNFFLDARTGSNLLLKAAGEKVRVFGNKQKIAVKSSLSGS